MIMHQLDFRLRRMLKELNDDVARQVLEVKDIGIAPRGEMDFAPYQNGEMWGTDSEWWDFRVRFTIPRDFCDMPVLRAITGREGGWDATNPQFVVRKDGRAIQALDVNHTLVVLDAKPGETVELILNGYAPPSAPYQAPPYLKLTLEDINENLRQLIFDLSVPYQAATLLPEGEREREVTLEALSCALDLLDLRKKHSEAFDESVADARAFLKETYYADRAKMTPIAEAEAVGHTHIDVAWLWDLYQTRHKTVRSFSTVLRLMELYPEYKFMSSQPQLYQFVKEDDPELYGRIKKAIADGRWEVEGGMWVEADCNVSGGEALARQFLYGQEFFDREFGKRSRILWLPDVFGYSAALPQLMKLSGIDYFMTTKISWNEYNMLPYDTFMWKGIDGTEVLTHFSPSRDYAGSGQKFLTNYTTYNAMLEPNQMAGGWKRFQQKGLDDHFLVTYGFGDGGGGPTDWMLESGRRMSVPLPVTPVVKQTHARPFFEALEERVAGDALLPKWSGELYLEYHRGTYTAIGRNKRSNRKMEIALREVELWRAMAAKKGLIYPKERLDAIWREMLTLQFHDILPGSSIKKVYDDSRIAYERMFEELDAMKAEALQVLGGEIAGDLVAFNSLSASRDDLIAFSAPETTRALVDARGLRAPVQFSEGTAYAYVRGLTPMGRTAFSFSDEAPKADALKVTKTGFETPFFKGRFDSAMRIESLYDLRADRELAKEGELLNRIVCYENKPHDYDAWDINIYYERRHWDVDEVRSVEVISEGEVFVQLRVTYAYMSSTITQDIFFYRDIPRIDFQTTVDWREKQYLLKAHFPVDLFYNEATYDVQYGNVKRPTHKNTSWDAARFEVCAHKWVDVSEDGYGVSLLNDCKYGHSIDEDGMALTLLKSSTHPAPDGDQEMHYFTYSLMPHVGGWREAKTVDMAYRLNIPVLTAKGGGEGDAPEGLFRVDAENVIIEAVKQPMKGEGTVVRLYECYGRRTQNVKLKAGFDITDAQIVNILEDPLNDAEWEGREIVFDLKPYEIKTFLVRG